MNYTDLTLFLEHRSTCVVRQTSSSNLFDVIIKENSSNSELFHENPSNEFDLLFSSPVDQIVINHETMSNSEITSTTMSSSSMTSAECPVCDQRCDGDITLENHIFEHSFCLDDEPSTSLLECKQCTITFTSNANLSLHKKLSQWKFIDCCFSSSFSIRFSSKFIVLRRSFVVLIVRVLNYSINRSILFFIRVIIRKNVRILDDVNKFFVADYVKSFVIRPNS